MTIRAYSAFGTLLKRGDGGATSATKASRTIGTSNQQIVIRAKTAGVAGNSKTCSIVVSGLSTAFALTVTASNVTITSATDGAGAATTTVNEAIYQLYQNATFEANFEATRGAGNGTGVVVAGASAALTGGADSAEVFTTVDGVRNLTGPTFSLETIDVTHHTSPNAYRETVPSFLSGGEASFDLLYDPADAQHEGIFTDYEGRLLRNWNIVLPDIGNMTYLFAGYVMGAEITSPIDNAQVVACKIGITGPVTRTA